MPPPSLNTVPGCAGFLFAHSAHKKYFFSAKRASSPTLLSMNEFIAPLLGIIDFIVHVDVHLHGILTQYGAWSYLVLFLVVFAETGLVVTPFLPGDSLLFAAGALCTGESLQLLPLLVVLFVAAILGDAVNYHVGRYLGPKVLAGQTRFLKPAYLAKTQGFYDTYGVKTIVLARFVPIVRTFAPFLAGVGSMRYRTFLTYNVIGAALWVGICTAAGYFFGNIPLVKKNFGLVVIGIILVSVLPMVIEVVRHKLAARKTASL